MRAEIPPLPEPMRSSHQDSEDDYLEWIRRFDTLWSSETSEQAQHEMQTLIRLIEQYELTQHRSHTLFTSISIKEGDVS